MIKDIVVNLEHRIGRDPARDFAITIAETFEAHVVGVTFAYAPDFPGYVTLEIPPDIVAAIVAEGEKAALTAIEPAGRCAGWASSGKFSPRLQPLNASAEYSGSLSRTS